MKRNKKNNIIKKIGTIVGIIAFLVVFRKPLLYTFYGTKYAVEGVNNGMVNFKSKIYSNISLFKEKTRIVSNSNEYIENIRKKEIEYQELELKLSDYESVKRDNEELKKILDLKKDLNIKTIAAKVKLIEESNKDLMFIDKGSKDGIIKGQVVLNNGKMIGLVDEVFSDFSKVKLLVNKDSKISVMINGLDLGVLRGNGNNTFSIKNYNRDLDDSMEYFKIVTSGISEFIPKGINIGIFKVKDKKILKEDKELIFEPDYNFLDINYVLVVKELKNE